ncbi:cytochrome c oxidase cbb3-type subunit 4 [Pseudidiomarina indica]|uniref:Cytochrome c oxidase cbb3-type subunit 4 n=1 Tax=Pseudidiomarina indica TaxID=1159017 RepID=A0A1G6A8P9_9GAMM|nr:cbb3-type cytochrome c oxidase subunit 3 [Pseudidiomarina indica]SDB04433.1 cytochrome c oxidase cbb3-type subunit 4 [Pseudidiomarina indica]
MDYITWRSFYTVLVFVLFIGVVWWAYSKGQKKNFDDAANSIFDDEQPSSKTNDSTKQESKNNE